MAGRDAGGCRILLSSLEPQIFCFRRQVHQCRTTKEALLQLAQQAPTAAYDLILKEHEPPRTDACKLLRRMAQADLLTTTPVVCKCAFPIPLGPRLCWLRRVGARLPAWPISN